MNIKIILIKVYLNIVKIFNNKLFRFCSIINKLKLLNKYKNNINNTYLNIYYLTRSMTEFEDTCPQLIF